jgi:hypothetical protein
MAYVAVLFLLIIASLLALAFARDVGTQLAVLEDRSSAMQAGYLAESAANHALWRVMGAGPEEAAVSADADDAEQAFSTLATTLSGQTLRLGQMEFVGLRFLNVQVPKGAEILGAHVEFTAALDESAPTSVVVWGEASDNAAAFSTGAGNLSKRSRTARSVGWWSLPIWTQGSVQETPDLRFILQELVERAGWSSGNDLVLLFGSSDPAGLRSAVSHDADPTQAPKLVVVYEESATTFDGETYYMHGLAGGRYAYKIRDKTDTTFATVAAVGAFDGIEAHQSYVMNLRPGENSSTPCLVGWWALNEGAGLVASDGSGSQNDGALVNLLGTEWTAGVSNGALDLSGLTDYVDLGANAAFQFPDAMTLALWVKPDSIKNSMLLDKGYLSSYYLYLKSSGAFKLACAALGSFWQVTSLNGVVKAGEWTHLAGTYDESTGEAVLYQNGVEAIRVSGLKLPISNNAESLVLGSNNSGTNYNLAGSVDDVRIYDCALTAAQIAEVYCSGLSLVASAGVDQTVSPLASNSMVTGSVTGSCPFGDSQPPTTTWSQISGPGLVAFADPSQLSTKVTFSLEGEYVLRLTAENAVQTTFDEVTFTVQRELYIESNQSWMLANNAVWTTVNLGGAPYNVPANAVVEVAILNTKSDKARYGGLRATGSALDRILKLHQAKNGGVEAVVMHAQTSGSSSLECKAENATEIQFVLLGYWDLGVYVERFDSFSAGTSDVWFARSLAPYGVGSGQVAEFVIENLKLNAEYQGGVRSCGSGVERRLTLHEAEEGGVDALSMLVKADDTVSAKIEVYAESPTNIRFNLTGYWSTPPGTFTEHFSDVGQPSSDGVWSNKALTGFGVPPRAAAQLALANLEAGAEQSIGLRSPGSSLSRTLQLHEAMDGGDYASLHVRTDLASTVEWYEQLSGVDCRFYLLGWWTP